MDKTINREQLIAEELIREHVRQRILFKTNEINIAEQKIRKVVRQLIEAETGTEEPSQSTGINVLADLLQKIIPTIEDSYKMLTTSKEQRDSFRNHIVHAVENSLRPIDAAGAATNENITYDIDPEFLREKVSINLDPQLDGKEAESIEGEFIDIGADGEDEEFVEIEDQNETGRNFAATAFNTICWLMMKTKTCFMITSLLTFYFTLISLKTNFKIHYQMYLPRNTKRKKIKKILATPAIWNLLENQSLPRIL